MRDGMGGLRRKSERRFEGALVGLFGCEGGGTGWKLELWGGLNLSSHGISDSVDLDSNYLLLNGKGKAGKLSTSSSAKNQSINLSTRETCQVDLRISNIRSKTRSITENL